MSCLFYDIALRLCYNGNMSELSEQLHEVLLNLTPEQRRFVVEYPNYGSKKATAAALGLNVGSVYNWGDTVDRAIELMQMDIVASALALRKQALARAMLVKLDGLDSDSETVRQKVATELIEWELGRAAMSIDTTVRGDTTLRVVYGDDGDNAGR